MVSAISILSLFFLILAYTVAEEDQNAVEVIAEEDQNAVEVIAEEDQNAVEVITEEDKNALNKVTLTEDIFGYINKTVPVKRYTWTNKNKMTVQVITYGGRITSIKLPDKYGNINDIVLGFDKLEDYLADNPYFGAIFGRVANRIVGANFTCNGVLYKLSANDNGDTFHGGTKGFDKVLWEPHVKGTELTLKYTSEDGENGFPGTVETQVTYELTADNVLRFEIHATTTKSTPISIGNHAYFNLADQGAGPEGIYEHTVSIKADRYLVVTSRGAPIGKIASVEGTDYDFLQDCPLGPRIKKRGGYDNYYCFNVKKKGEILYVLRVKHPKSGRMLEMCSNQPGLLFYTTIHLPQKGAADVIKGKAGAEYILHGGVCMETHDYPDAVHHSNFPSTMLNPGENYSRITCYKFSTMK